MSNILKEANRCLYCFEPPCQKACPTNINIPSFIKKIAEDNPISAGKTIFESNILGYSCAKVCPTEVLCEGACVLKEAPINISKLQEYACLNTMEKQTSQEIFPLKESKKLYKIALIGAGPASLTVASILSRYGHQNFIYEKRSFAGGLNSYGVADYKLNFNESQKEIVWLSNKNINFIFNKNITNKDIENFSQEYDVIFIGSGLGENKIQYKAKNIIGAIDLIEKIKTDPNFSLKNINKAYVIGGGNTAIDAANHLALLNIPYVAMLYRGKKENMSGYRHELKKAQENGVHFFDNINIEELNIKNDILDGFYINNNEYLKCDLLIYAIGQENNLKLIKSENIFYGGDVLNGGKEVVNAVEDGKIAAEKILQYLENKK